MTKMLTLCFELADNDIAQGIAAKYATGFDAHGLRALLDVGTVIEARLLAIPRPGNTTPRFSAMLLCTTYEGPVDVYLEGFYRRLPHEFCGLGISAKSQPFEVTPELVEIVLSHATSPRALQLLAGLYGQFRAWVDKNDLTRNASLVSLPPETQGLSQFIRATQAAGTGGNWPPAKLALRASQSLADNLFVVLHDPTSKGTEGIVRREVLRELSRLAREAGVTAQDVRDARRIAQALRQHEDANAGWVLELADSLPEPRSFCGDPSHPEMQGGEPPRESRLPSITWGQGADDLDDAASVAGFCQRMTAIQQQLRQKMPGEQVPHGLHEKQHFGGLATVRVHAQLPEFLRFGPFQPGAVLGALARFSNGAGGCPRHDAKPDVRAIALKMFDADGAAWDALLTNQLATHTKTAEQAIQFSELLTQLQPDEKGEEPKLTPALLQPVFGRDEGQRIFEQLLHDTVQHRVESLTTETYYGGMFRIPSETGGGLLCKLVLKPVASNEAIETDRSRDDWLARELEAQLERGPVRMRLFVQVYTGDGERPSPADASAVWLSPEYELAELELPPPRGAARDELPELVKRVAFNPANGFVPAYLTHTRKAIYEQSAKNREALSAEGARAVWERFQV
jgi:hypothetical protein